MSFSDSRSSSKVGYGWMANVLITRVCRQQEKKPLANTTGSTLDVDALWKSMNSGSVKKPSTPSTPITSEDVDRQSTPASKEANPTSTTEHAGNGVATNASTEQGTSNNAEEMITIKRTYVFAGDTITEEKVVPKSSAEAKLYLSSQARDGQNGSAASQTSKPPLRRPKKRASLFEPNPAGTVKGLDAKSSNKGPKLNTIEKSKMDWAGFVDKEGIKDDLDTHGKGKEGYLGRMDFLGRSEAKREEELNNARRKG